MTPRRWIALVCAALVIGACARPVVDACYDVAKLRRAHYNDHRLSVSEWNLIEQTRLSPDGIRVLDAMATEWLTQKQAEQQSIQRKTPAAASKPSAK